MSLDSAYVDRPGADLVGFNWGHASLRLNLYKLDKSEKSNKTAACKSTTE